MFSNNAGIDNAMKMREMFLSSGYKVSYNHFKHEHPHFNLIIIQVHDPIKKAYIFNNDGTYKSV